MYKVVVLYVFLSACSILGQTGAEKPVFSLEKSSCYGECPVYVLKIYKSGKMLFSGSQNTKYIGRYCAILESVDFERLKVAFVNQAYFSMKEAYLSKAKDLPSTISSFYYEGREKKIMDYDNAPASLKQLEKMLETIVDTTRWTGCK